MAKEISVDKCSVKKLLESGRNKLFVVPEYQRPYVWGIDKVETLFYDIWDFAVELNDENENITYFLGTIVSYDKVIDKDNTVQEIIDGQQRITSLFLLLRAIYTKLSLSKDKTKEAQYFIKQIEPAIWKVNKYTGEVYYSENLLRFEVINDDGNAILNKILETGKTEDNANDPYSINYNKFIELFESVSLDFPLMIYKFLNILLNQVILLPIIAGDQDSALTIFSTLNDRGEPLSDSDIFKARIYNNIKDLAKRSEFISSWQTLDEDSVSVGESIQKLFYYYMFYLRALKGDTKTTTPGLRNYFLKTDINSLFDTNLLTNLTKILNFWKVVNNREEIETESWSKDNNILTVLDSLKDYPNEFWKYPVIIYYLVHSQNTNFNVEFLSFLRRFYAFLLVKYLETPTINAVKSEILKLNYEVISNVKPEFIPLNIDNEEFKNKIKTPHPNTIRMLLKTMAYLEQEELLPSTWQIEHIFPRKWHKNYFPADMNEKDIIKKIEELGNKIPLEKKLNIEAGNGYFGKKKDKYAKSVIKVAKKMSESNIDEWNLNHIYERNIEVSKNIQELLKTWINNYDNESIETTPDEDALKIIEEYRRKGWID